MGLLGALIRGRGGRRRRGRSNGGAACLASAAAEWVARPLAAHKRDDGLEEDAEAPLPRARRRICEPCHGMPDRRSVASVDGILLEDDGEAGRGGGDRGRASPRSRRTRSSRTDDEKQLLKKIERQQKDADVTAKAQKMRHQEYAKLQILKSKSSAELLENAFTLIDEDWTNDIDVLEGNVYSIGAFGALNIPKEESSSRSWSGIRSRSRLVGCCVIAMVQILGPPCVLCSDLSDMYASRQVWDPTDPAGSLIDWRVRGPTKLLGTLLLFLFILNGLFVVVQCKDTWFKLYNTFQYLKRTADFEVQGQGFLYLGAFIDCWTVFLCCAACYIVVGTSPTVQDVLFDSLTLLFLYNLDEVGGDLGFVEEDDWPGDRLGWIFKHMVKVDWQPGEEEAAKSFWELKRQAKERMACKMGCGKPVKKGFDTCCRACAKGKAPPHDHDCGDADKAVSDDGGSGAEDAIEPTEHVMLRSDSYEGGERKDWNVGGYIVLAWYTATVYLLVAMAFVLPLLEIYTPFSQLAVDNR